MAVSVTDWVPSNWLQTKSEQLYDASKMLVEQPVGALGFSTVKVTVPIAPVSGE